jgi:hypothetical protein
MWSGDSDASSDLVEMVQNHLYAGRTAEAAAAARGRLADAPDDDQARFALGVVQFLQAVEHLGQALHKYGLRDTYMGHYSFTGLQTLRFPVPENSDPERVTYEALRGVLDGLVVDLETAEQTLGSVKNQTIDLSLDIGQIWLDLDSDGAASDEELLWRIVKSVAGLPWLSEKEAGKLQTDFDESDAPWLQAYCHLLMAIAEFPLAHDWRNAFETTFHGYFPEAGLRLSAIGQRDADAPAELGRWLRGAFPRPPDQQPGEDREDYMERRKEWLETPEGEEWQRSKKHRERAKFGGLADTIAFIHLTHWPVVEPERMRSVLGHLEAMVQLSREYWRRINAETDDRNEWIPNPRQSGVLPRMQVTEDRVAGWHRFLDEFQALLEGKKLIPHWRFDQGVNLRRIFLEPTTFDIVFLFQGTAALPYLEDGDLTTEQTWDQITRVFGGDFFRYFIWFN